MTAQEFEKYVKQQCRQLGVRYRGRNTTYIKANGLPCSGYYCEDELVIAKNRDEYKWLSTLVHEFAHTIQDKEKMPAWAKEEKTYSLLYFDLWLKGHPVPNIKKHMQVVRNLELECERVTVSLIKKYQLPLDIKRYIRAANAILWYYTWTLETQKWISPSRTVWDNERLLAVCPTRFARDFDTIPPAVRKIFAAEYS